jgi:hypothetical protein
LFRYYIFFFHLCNFFYFILVDDAIERLTTEGSWAFEFLASSVVSYLNRDTLICQQTFICFRTKQISYNIWKVKHFQTHLQILRSVLLNRFNGLNNMYFWGLFATCCVCLLQPRPIYVYEWQLEPFLSEVPLHPNLIPVWHFRKVVVVLLIGSEFERIQISNCERKLMGPTWPNKIWLSNYLYG